MIDHTGGKQGEIIHPIGFLLCSLHSQNVNFFNTFEWVMIDKVFHHPWGTTRFHSTEMKDGDNDVIKDLAGTGHECLTETTQYTLLIAGVYFGVKFSYQIFQQMVLTELQQTTD